MKQLNGNEKEILTKDIRIESKEIILDENMMLYIYKDDYGYWWDLYNRDADNKWNIIESNDCFETMRKAELDFFNNCL